MGIVNVTPDSFSDGGAHLAESAAIAHGKALVAAGADIIDVGGESTRPGARPISAAEEQARVLGVVKNLAAAGVVVSIDTLHAETAKAAAELGASFVNDVSGGLADPAMAAAVADAGIAYVIGHWRGTPQTMRNYADYADPVEEVCRELAARAAAAVQAGVPPGRIVLDPGLGFAKRAPHNWHLLSRLDRLQELGHPVLIGASRKRFLAGLVPAGAAPSGRDLPTAVLSVLAAQHQVWGVRVHDVEMTRIALGTWAAWQSAAGSPG